VLLLKVFHCRLFCDPRNSWYTPPRGVKLLMKIARFCSALSLPISMHAAERSRNFQSDGLLIGAVEVPLNRHKVEIM